MKKLSLLCLPFLLSGCVAPLIVAGAGSVLTNHAAQDRGIIGSASDQLLRYRVNQMLEGGLTNFDGLELTVYKGKVLLTGVAADETVKKEAVRITSLVEGVKQVIDGMNTKADDGVAEYTRDGWITTKLKGSLYVDEDIVAPNYVIRTFDKTIYIFGTAQCQEEVQKVMEHAADIKGVKRIVPMIEVLPPPPVPVAPAVVTPVAPAPAPVVITPAPVVTPVGAAR